MLPAGTHVFLIAVGPPLLALPPLAALVLNAGLMTLTHNPGQQSVTGGSSQTPKVWSATSSISAAYRFASSCHPGCLLLHLPSFSSAAGYCDTQLLSHPLSRQRLRLVAGAVEIALQAPPSAVGALVGKSGER